MQTNIYYLESGISELVFAADKIRCQTTLIFRYLRVKTTKLQLFILFLVTLRVSMVPVL